MTDQVEPGLDQKSGSSPYQMFRPGDLVLVDFPVVDDELEALLGPPARRHAPCVVAGCQCIEETVEVEEGQFETVPAWRYQVRLLENAEEWWADPAWLTPFVALDLDAEEPDPLSIHPRIGGHRAMRNEALSIPVPGPHRGGPVPGLRLALKPLIGRYLQNAPRARAVYVTLAQHKRLQYAGAVRFRNRDYPVEAFEMDGPLTRKRRAAMKRGEPVVEGIPARLRHDPATDGRNSRVEPISQ